MNQSKHDRDGDQFNYLPNKKNISNDFLICKRHIAGSRTPTFVANQAVGTELENVLAIMV